MTVYITDLRFRLVRPFIRLRAAICRAVVCPLVGHRPQSNPARAFSYRLGVCTRCHRIPTLAAERNR